MTSAKLQYLNNVDAIGLLLQNAPDCTITTNETGDTLITLCLGHWIESRVFLVNAHIWNRVKRYYAEEIERWNNAEKSD